MEQQHPLSRMTPAADPPVATLRRSSRRSATTSTLVSLSLETPLRPSKRRAHSTDTDKRFASADSLAELPRPTKRRKDPYSHLGAAPLTDRIQDNLDVLFCGENPGVRTAELQLHYASPHNHFYKCLHAAGLTPSVLPPTASRTLPEDYNVGITNLIERPTREASELGKAELEAAVPVLLAKVARYRPKLVAFVGMKVCETVLRHLTPATPPPPAPSPSGSSARPALVQASHSSSNSKVKKPPPIKAQIGLQRFALSHPPSATDSERTLTYFYCLPSTSGRVAAYPLPVKLQLWATFGAEVAKLCACPPVPLSLPQGFVAHEVEALDLPSPLPLPLAAVELGGPVKQEALASAAGVKEECGVEATEAAAPSEGKGAEEVKFAAGRWVKEEEVDAGLLTGVA